MVYLCSIAKVVKPGRVKVRKKPTMKSDTMHSQNVHSTVGERNKQRV
jgi:hypothetical protein